MSKKQFSDFYYILSVKQKQLKFRLWQRHPVQNPLQIRILNNPIKHGLRVLPLVANLSDIAYYKRKQ